MRAEPAPRRRQPDRARPRRGAVPAAAPLALPGDRRLYPVEADFLVRLPEGVRRFHLRPLFDAQELDGRGAGMPVYWEGAVTTEGGRGYLDLPATRTHRM
jgi:hypothetical protein